MEINQFIGACVRAAVADGLKTMAEELKGGERLLTAGEVCQRLNVGMTNFIKLQPDLIARGLKRKMLGKGRILYVASSVDRVIENLEGE